MQIRTIDGRGTIEINAVDARLKMACTAESEGNGALAKKWFTNARLVERDFAFETAFGPLLV